MPLAKIHVVKGRYDEGRIAKVSAAIQAALMNTLRVPPEDFYQLIFEFPKKRFLHTPSFVGMQYTDDLIILDLTFIEGRSKETRLALLKDINTRVAAAASVSPDDLMITLYEAPGENFSSSPTETPSHSRTRPAALVRRKANESAFISRGASVIAWSANPARR
jgi:phenylpyruvate tautomerase PptA (4-oxalocrotonate tautomerase family)